MINGNEPISPILDSDGNGSNKGLTKREHMAIEFTKALTAHNGTMYEHTVESNVRRAIKLADELIRQLNSEDKQ